MGVFATLPLPPAEQVTEIKLGSKLESSCPTSRAATSVRFPFGGKISNETESDELFIMSLIVSMVSMIPFRPKIPQSAHEIFGLRNESAANRSVQTNLGIVFHSSSFLSANLFPTRGTILTRHAPKVNREATFTTGFN